MEPHAVKGQRPGLRGMRSWRCPAWRVWQLGQQLGAHSSQPRKGKQGQGKGLRHKGASCCTKQGEQGAGGAGAGAGSMGGQGQANRVRCLRTPDETTEGSRNKEQRNRRENAGVRKV
eukprot:1162117-Pelagomonas_calceolata.AAC.9